MRFRKHRSARRKVDAAVDPDFAQALSGTTFEKNSRTKYFHKAQQLCRQVQRALSLSLSGELLDELQIVDVTPGAGGSHLLVYVEIPRHRSVAEVISRLEEVSPRLRSEVARAVTRKQAPLLTFVPAAIREEKP